MNYEILKNREKFQEFLEWLPDCKENEQFYIALFSRKKYCPEVPWIKSDKAQLKRGTSTKERLEQKIMQMECAFGSYKHGENPVPQESLALYISTNPRDLWKATIRSIGALAKVVECYGHNSNPHQEVMSEIQRTAGTRKYITFDIDEKNDKLLEEVIGIVDGKCDVLETRGGYHVFVHKALVDDITDKKWYKRITDMPACDQAGDTMSPIAGCLQGMFVPHFIYRIK